MRKPTKVIVIRTGANASVDSFYQSVEEYMDAKYHQPGNHFPHYQMSDQEIAEQESLSSAALHAKEE
jgi:hypothetical protein